MTGPFADPVVDKVAQALAEARRLHEEVGLTPPADEALARAALAAMGRTS